MIKHSEGREAALKAIPVDGIPEENQAEYREYVYYARLLGREVRPFWVNQLQVAPQCEALDWMIHGLAAAKGVVIEERHLLQALTLTSQWVKAAGEGTFSAYDLAAEFEKMEGLAPLAKEIRRFLKDPRMPSAWGGNRAKL